MHAGGKAVLSMFSSEGTTRGVAMVVQVAGCTSTTM
jgi:hypothetical protein